MTNQYKFSVVDTDKGKAAFLTCSLPDGTIVSAAEPIKFVPFDLDSPPFAASNVEDITDLLTAVRDGAEGHVKPKRSPYVVVEDYRASTLIDLRGVIGVRMVTNQKWFRTTTYEIYVRHDITGGVYSFTDKQKAYNVFMDIVAGVLEWRK